MILFLTQSSISFTYTIFNILSHVFFNISHEKHKIFIIGRCKGIIFHDEPIALVVKTTTNSKIIDTCCLNYWKRESSRVCGYKWKQKNQCVAGAKRLSQYYSSAIPSTTRMIFEGNSKWRYLCFYELRKLYKTMYLTLSNGGTQLVRSGYCYFKGFQLQFAYLHMILQALLLTNT